MHIRLITVPKQKTWGPLEHRTHPDHFLTGFAGYRWDPDDDVPMRGQNVVITGDFHIDSMSRGDSAANFDGHFRGHETVAYKFGMQGMVHLLDLIQSGKFQIVDGYISGTWTLAKQGMSIFLKPHFDA